MCSKKIPTLAWAINALLHQSKNSTRRNFLTNVQILISEYSTLIINAWRNKIIVFWAYQLQFSCSSSYSKFVVCFRWSADFGCLSLPITSAVSMWGCNWLCRRDTFAVCRFGTRAMPLYPRFTRIPVPWCGVYWSARSTLHHQQIVRIFHNSVCFNISLFYHKSNKKIILATKRRY